MADSITDLRRSLFVDDPLAGGLKPGTSIDEYEAKIAELIKSNIELAKANKTDPLTGLPNDVAYEEDVKVLDGRWERGMYFGAMIGGDLTGLGRINDGLSYELGNIYLIAGADTIASSGRPSDQRWRLGKTSDEFLIWLDGVSDINNVQEFLNRLNDGLQRAHDQLNIPDSYPFSFSFAVCTVTADRRPSQAATAALNALGAAKKEKRKETGIKGGRVANIFIDNE